MRCLFSTDRFMPPSAAANAAATNIEVTSIAVTTMNMENPRSPRG